VRYNFIAKNGQSGIHLMASNATIEHNVIVKNTNGISLMDGSFAKVRYNTIKGNKLTGIWLETGAPGAEVVANTIVNNSRAVGGLEFYPLVLNFNNLQNLEMEIDIEEEAVGEIDATNNWWGTEDENLIVGKINDPAGIVTYSPLAEEITEHKEEITSTIQFDYEDLRPYELGYTPGDQARDKFLWVLPDDNTRRIVKRLSHGEEFPWSLTWVKGELWMANNLGVFRIDPETGEMTRAFNRPGLRPWGMTFDGTNLWINDFTGLRIYEVSLDGEVLSSFSYAELFPKGLNGMAWDGEYLYLTGWVEYLGLIKFDRAGNFIEHINMNQFIGGGLTFDGEHFWAQGCNGKIYKIDKNGNVLGWISSGSTTTMFDLAWDGQYLWSGERTNEMWDDEKIFKLEILQVMR
jgi:parallel beta-helix repeat protein